MKSYYHGGKSKNAIPYKKTLTEFIRTLPMEQIEEELARYYSHVALGFLGYSDRESFDLHGPSSFELLAETISLPDSVVKKIEAEAKQVAVRQKKVQKAYRKKR